MIYLAGTDTTQCRFAIKARTLAQAKRQAEARGCRYWAAYRDTSGFHSTTQREYLVAHHNDPYWINSGVPSHG